MTPWSAVALASLLARGLLGGWSGVREADPAGVVGGKGPGVPADQVRAVPAARDGGAGGYLDEDDQVVLEDQHVMPLTTDDRPDLAVMSVYITSAYRAHQLADHYRRRGSHVALGGLHVTALPDEAARHADTVFLGPGGGHLAALPRRLPA
jgi:hypothetical protein